MVTTSSEDKSSSQLTDSYLRKSIELPQRVETYTQATSSLFVASTRKPSSMRQARVREKRTIFLGYVQRSRSQSTASHEELISDLQALQQVAHRQQQSRIYWNQSGFTQSHYPELSGYHADPLEPLRERDMLALSQWFLRNDMGEIEADVNHRLLSLLPEPCWDENPFEFLTEFL